MPEVTGSSFDEAREESERLKWLAGDIASRLSDEKLNTEHYQSANQTLERLHEVMGKDAAYAYMDAIMLTRGDEELSAYIDAMPIRISQTLEERVPDAVNKMKSLKVTDEAKYLDYLHNIPYSMAVNVVENAEEDSGGHEFSIELKTRLWWLVYQMTKQFLLKKDFLPDLETPRENYEYEIGLPLENISFPSGVEFIFEETERHKGNIQYIGYLKLKKDDGNFEWINLTEYFSNDGKKVYFSGLKNAHDIAGGMPACMTKLPGENFHVGVEMESFRESELRALYYLFHEFGHVNDYGENDLKMLRRVCEAMIQLPDFDDLNLPGNPDLNDKMRRMVESSKRSLERLESQTKAGENPEQDEQIAALKLGMDAYETILTMIGNPDFQQSESVLKATQYLPYLDQAVRLEMENSANDYAVRKIEEIRPGMYDYKSRVQTIAKRISLINKDLYGKHD